MAKKVLKEYYRQQIIADTELQAKISKFQSCSVPTVKRWAENSHKMLLHALTLDAIKAYFSLPSDEVLYEELKTESETKTRA